MIENTTRLFIISLFLSNEPSSCPSSISLVYSEQPANTIVAGKEYVGKYTLTTTLDTVKNDYSDVSHANIHSCKKEMGIRSQLFYTFNKSIILFSVVCFIRRVRSERSCNGGSGDTNESSQDKFHVDEHARSKRHDKISDDRIYDEP